MIVINFLEWLTVYEHEKQMMKVMMVLKKQRPKPKKVNRKRTSLISRSNILKKIIDSLENGNYQHMLYWHDRKKREFIVKFVHMNNKEFKKADYLALFKALDKLSNNYEEYLKDKKYKHSCKVRCKSNLTKLCGDDNNGALTLIKKINVEKSIQLRKYKLNCDNMLGINNTPNIENMTKRGNVESPVGQTLLDTYCVTESRNKNVRNAMSQMDPSTVYEHEKQMNENVVASPTMFVEDPASCGFGSSSIEENDNCESMEYSELLGSKMQSDETIQNVVTSPVIFIENPASCGFGSSSIEENDNRGLMEYSESLGPKMQSNGTIQNVVSLPVMFIENSALCGFGSFSSIEENDNRGLMECSELLALKIQSDMTIQNNEEFEDANIKTNSLSQLVPSSPLHLEGISNVPFYEYYTDYRTDIDKLLQRDNDPLLSSTSGDLLNTNMSEWNGDLRLDTEDWYSFGNLSSIDDA